MKERSKEKVLSVLIVIAAYTVAALLAVVVYFKLKYLLT